MGRLVFLSIGCLYLLMVGGCVGLQRDDSRLLDQRLGGSPDSQTTELSAAAELNRSLPVPANAQALSLHDYEIGPQDLLEVNLFNIEATDGLPSKLHVRVGNTGFITLPLLGQVHVGGLTRIQAEEILRKEYGKFMHEPELGVTLAENRSKSVYVLGAVRNPGIFPVTGQENLRRLLAMAGGLSKEAGMYVHISRQSAAGDQAHVISLRDLANDKKGDLNVPVRPGDFINVPVAGTFYVDGYVQKPNAYPLLQRYTLSQALVIAGGLDPDGKASDITVLRRTPEGELNTMAYDLAKIRSKEQEDPHVQEDDVIVVPPNTAKIVLSALLGMVGYTGRSASYSWTIGRSGGRGFALP